MSWLKKVINTFKHSEQAEQIFAWLIDKGESGQATVKIINKSNLPVYKIILSIVNIQNDTSNGLDTPEYFRTFLILITPGESSIKVEPHRGMNFISGIEIAFEDFNRRYWIRKADNSLQSLKVPPQEYYNIPTPISWETPIKSNA